MTDKTVTGAHLRRARLEDVRRLARFEGLRIGGMSKRQIVRLLLWRWRVRNRA